MTGTLPSDECTHGLHSVYLETVPADSAPNLSICMEIVQAHNLQSKTIGVFTMCDEVPQRKMPNFLARCQNLASEESAVNGAVHLQPHGWIACMNAQPKGLAPEVTGCTRWRSHFVFLS